MRTVEVDVLSVAEPLFEVGEALLTLEERPLCAQEAPLEKGTLVEEDPLQL